VSGADAMLRRGQQGRQNCCCRLPPSCVRYPRKRATEHSQGREPFMFRLIRWLLVLLICFVGIGLYRGWFSFSSSGSNTDGSKETIDMSMDKGKMKADVEKAREKIREKIKGIGDKAKATETK
jgi:hypothetical protein